MIWREVLIAVVLSVVGLAALIRFSRKTETNWCAERAEHDATWRRRNATHDGALVPATQLRRRDGAVPELPTERELMLEANAYATKATERPWRRRS